MNSIDHDTLSNTDDESMKVTREEAQAYIDAIRSAGGLQPEQPQPDGRVRPVKAAFLSFPF